MTSLTFLVVDDEPGIRKVLSRVLTRFGHSVVLATTGEEAVQVLEASEIDVVMMDLRMPSMSGQTLYHAIASQWPELVGRVVVMSGDLEAEDHESWLSLHSLPLLPKPFEIAQLLDLIQQLTASPRREANGQ
jgi:two-component system cell cycle sensor histidine kinase/response regulator CckA